MGFCGGGGGGAGGGWGGGGGGGGEGRVLRLVASAAAGQSRTPALVRVHGQLRQQASSLFCVPDFHSAGFQLGSRSAAFPGPTLRNIYTLQI